MESHDYKVLWAITLQLDKSNKIKAESVIQLINLAIRTASVLEPSLANYNIRTRPDTLDLARRVAEALTPTSSDTFRETFGQIPTDQARNIEALTQIVNQKSHNKLEL